MGMPQGLQALSSSFKLDQCSQISNHHYHDHQPHNNSNHYHNEVHRHLIHQLLKC